MSKIEIALYMVVSSVLIAVCHGQGGLLFDAGLVIAGIMQGAVLWVVLNEENKDAE
jgi:hypothetical protein